MTHHVDHFSRQMMDSKWKRESIIVLWLGDYLTSDINNACAYVPNAVFCDEIVLQDNYIDVYWPHRRRLSASGILYLFIEFVYRWESVILSVNER